MENLIALPLNLFAIDRTSDVHLVLLNLSIYRKQAHQLKRVHRRRRRHMANERRRRYRLFVEKMYYLVACYIANCISNVDRKRIWCKERNSCWFETIKLSSDFKKHFRMEKETFDKLVLEIKPFIKKTDTQFRKAVPAEIRLAATLWRLGTNVEYRTIAELFGIGQSTCVTVVNETILIICKLSVKYIKMPGGNDLLKVIAGFEKKAGFPQVGGAIDGTHIKILAPSVDATDYYSRYKCHTMLLQAVVDDNGCFTNINIGWPGKAHDCRVFKNSEIFAKGNSGHLFSPYPRMISNTEVPVLIIADPAYPLLPWLLKPYPGTDLCSSKQLFNYKLSATRMAVEMAFGQLKGRWRCLMKRLDCKVGNVPFVVTACCVLHNFCHYHKDGDLTSAPENFEGFFSPSTAETRSNDVRDAICRYFDNSNF